MSNTTSSGLALPLKNGVGGAFQPKTGADLAWGALLYALFCPVGSRVMQRDYGSRLYQLAFSPLTDSTASEVSTIVRRCAEDWVPQISIDGVKSLLIPGTKRLQISVRFRLSRDATIHERSTELQTQQGTP